MSDGFHPNNPNPHNDRSTDQSENWGSRLLLKSRYRILPPLSPGKRHRTFLALDQHRPSKPHCILQKFSTSDRSAIERVLHSIESICQHPQLPNFLASFTDQDDLYLVQDYIPGLNLAEELQIGGCFNEQQIRDLLGELLPILQYIHDRHLIHGDLKPENLIRREPDSKLMLVDLGSTRIHTQQPSQESAQPTGSAEYAAPEQLQGQVFPSSDLYSLGVICLHLLTNVQPFAWLETDKSLMQWRSQLKTKISKRLSLILDRLIQPSLEHRYRSATEVLAELSTTDPLPPFLNQLARWDVAATVGVGITLALTTLIPRPLTPQPETAFAPTEPPKPQLYHRPLRSVRPGTHTLSSAWGSVWSVAVSPDGRTLVSGGDNGMIQLRQLNSTCWQSDSCHPTQILRGHSGAVWTLAIDPQGRLLASGGKDKTVKLWNLQTGQLIDILYPQGGEVFDLAFSPDGQTLASVGEDGKVRLWQIPTTHGHLGLTSLQQTFQGHTDEVKSVAFLPDGNRFVTGSADGTLKIWDTRSGQTLINLPQGAPVWSVAVSPDGRTLASSTADGKMAMWDLATGDPVHQIGASEMPCHRKPRQSLVFSPDGQTLASADIQGKIELWHVGTGNRFGVLQQHSGWVDLAFSPNGQMLLSGSYDDTLKLWQMPQRTPISDISPGSDVFR